MLARLDAVFAALLERLSTAPGRAMAAAALLAVVLAAPGFFTLPPSDRDESRFAQASKQMLESGDYVDIRFQDIPRHKKPAGIYWLQSAAASVFGGTDAPIWAYRLPSLTGTAAAAALLVWALWPVIGGTGATLAGLMLAATLLPQVEARIAKTDAVLLTATIAAMGAVARVWLQASTHRVALIFWAALSVGILLKGPVILLPIGGAMIWLSVAGRSGRWLWGLRPFPYALLAAAVTAPWFIAIALRTDGGFFAEAVGRDLGAKIASGQEAHGAPPGTYALALIGTLWPWTLFAALAAPWVWRQRRDSRPQILLAWLCPAWLAFELIPTKLPHYVLPLYPALIGLTAAAIVSGFGRAVPLKGWRFWAPAGVFMLAPAALTVALGGIAITLSKIGAAPVGWAIALGLAATAVTVTAGFAAARRRFYAAVTLCLTAAAAVYAGAFHAGLPRLEPVWISPRLTAETERLQTECGVGPVALVGYHEPSAVFLLGRDTALLGGEIDAWLAERPNGLLWIANEQGRPPIAPPDDGAPMATFEGFNYNGGDWLTLTAYHGACR